MLGVFYNILKMYLEGGYKATNSNLRRVVSHVKIDRKC